MTKRVELLIYGAGGHAHAVVDAALTCQGFRAAGLLDDNTALHGSKVLDVPVLGGIDAIDVVTAYEWVIAVGDPSDREALAKRLTERRCRFAVVVHPAAYVARGVAIGEGTVVLPLAVVQSDANIGCHAIVNSGAIVEHECCIGDFAHISPGAQLGGGVVVGRGAHVGLGASVAPGVHIGAGAVVGAGSAAIRDVEAGAVVGGVPAKPLLGRSM